MVSNMSCRELEDFFTSILKVKEDIIKAFESEDVDESVFLEMDIDDLSKIGKFSFGMTKEIHTMMFYFKQEKSKSILSFQR